MKYLGGRFMIAKHILLSIWAFGHPLKLIDSIFRFANLAFAFIKIIFGKIQLAFELFLPKQRFL